MKTRLFLAACALAAATQPLAAAPAPITGRWTTESKDALVEVAPCGKQLCGTIVKFLTPPKGGADPRDVNNADPAKRSRPIMGMAILTGFAAKGDEWHGQIYDPRSGKTYRSVLTAAGTRLNVKGCVSVFCKTQVWTRAK